MRLDQYSVGNYTPGASIWKQLFWYFLGAPLVESYVLPFSGLKVWLLRRFGATIGQGVRIKPGVRIKFPWRLTIGNHCWIGENAWFDTIAPIALEDHVCISQDAYLCTGNHDWTAPQFTLRPGSIYIESGSWIAARAVVGPGVTIGHGAILSLGSVTGRSLDAMTIYAGNPAVPVRERKVMQAETLHSVSPPHV